jgi:hypothetical protein
MNTPTIQPQEKHMRSVVWQKIVAFVETHSIRSMLKFVGLSFVAGLLSAAASSPDETDRYFSLIMEWRNYTVPVTLWVVFLTFYGRRIVLWTFGSVADVLSQREAEEEDADLRIEGIPVTALVDHLMKFKTFKRDDIEQKFLVPRYRYTALAKKLKEIGVLTHGLNNMSVLGPEWDRDTLTDLFSGKEGADELEKGINIVRPLPSPPLFSRRRISDETAKESHVQPIVQPMGNRRAALCATA